MLDALKIIGAVAGLFLLIPLCVWGGSGSLREAWYATKQFLLIIGGLFVLVGGLAFITSIPLLWK